MQAFLEYHDDSSHKFWEIRVEGTSHTVRYGRVGAKGQTKTKDFDSPEQALKAAEKLVKAKRKKGYADAGPGDGDSAGGFDLDALIERVTRELPFGPDGNPLPGNAVRFDGGPAHLALHPVQNDALGLTVVRIFNLERGDELIAIRGGCERDGVYFLNHEAGLFSVEELDGDEDVFDDALDFTDVDAWAQLPADQRIALLEEEVELEPMGDLFEAIEVETWELTASPQLEVSVEQRIPPGDVHGRALVSFDGALYTVGFSELLRIEPDGSVVVIGPAPHGDPVVCVHDGALYLGGKSLARYTVEEGITEVPLHADVPSTSYGCIYSLVEHDGALWAGCAKGALCRLVDGTLVLEHTMAGADDVKGLASTDEGLWIAPFKKGLKRLDATGKLRSGGVRAGRLLQVLQSGTGAMLVVCQGKDSEPGCIYRRGSGEKKFAQNRLPEGVCVQLAQLPSGRLVGAGTLSRLFVSDDDGCSFMVVESGFLGLTSGQPRRRDFESAAAHGDAVIVGGGYAPTLAVR